MLLANLIFFMPRRRVDMTIERVDRSQLPETERDKVNRWFEAWYNAEGPEQPTYVPYHFLFGQRSYEFPPLMCSSEDEIALEQVAPEARDAVAEVLADQLGRPPTTEELRADTRLDDDLALDSLQRMDLTLALERRFGFSADTAPVTVGQLLALAEGRIEKEAAKPAPPEWFQPTSVEEPPEILGDTIPAAFIARVRANPGDVAAADDLAGIVSYRRLLVGARLLARRFARLPAANIGLMLPASIACDTTLLGLYLAGKLPVLLNWTTGPAHLNHGVRLTGVTHVITSRRLRDRLGIVIEGVQFLDLEDLGAQIGMFERLRTLLATRFQPGHLSGKTPQMGVDAPAAVLFTSGSEAAPKVVPLTNQNIISNQRGALAALGPTRRDSVLACLPMFHSFGFTMTGLLPLLAGIRVVHHSDPTDASGLLRKIISYKPTIFVGTPTFVGHVFERAKRGQLDSLRLIIVGAETCPPALFDKCRQLAPSAQLLEGYGITECSPVVAFNRPNDNRPGTLGKPFPGVELRVVDLETHAPLASGQPGMLLVSGPNVFRGYLGSEQAPPFLESDCKRWFLTGDVADIDADSFVHFHGRLKRFVKAGGEMLSLPALEAPFVRLYPPTRNGPRVAVEGLETEKARRIVLFTTEAITLKEANARLQDEGFYGVMRLDEVRHVEKIPVLGTGKIDYLRLRAMIGERMPA